MRRWRIHFITASWDEPGDTVIPVVDESGGLVEASSQQEAETKFVGSARGSALLGVCIRGRAMSDHVFGVTLTDAGREVVRLQDRVYDLERELAEQKRINEFDRVVPIQELQEDLADLRAWGDQIQSEASRLAEWGEVEFLNMSYEVQQALTAVKSLIDGWTEMRSTRT
jgi:hypothetical protein